MKVDENEVQKCGRKLCIEQAIKNNVGQGLIGSQRALTARTTLGVFIKFQVNLSSWKYIASSKGVSTSGRKFTHAKLCCGLAFIHVYDRLIV